MRSARATTSVPKNTKQATSAPTAAVVRKYAPASTALAASIARKFFKFRYITFLWLWSGNGWVACRQRGCPHAGEVPYRKIPGSNDSYYSNGLRNHRHPFVVATGWYCAAIGTFGFFSKPFNKACAIHDFALGFSDRFTLLSRHQFREIVCMSDDQIKPFAHEL